MKYINMVKVEKSEYESYINGLNNPTTDNYNVCGEEKLYHKLKGEVIACKTVLDNDDEVIYEINK